ncbi:CAP domain-containing protein [Methanoregula sp.]|uniref:CAP domain-containing protein n=1 Tax=Methanoregula sp. TaxID=2052170 RepID=UPI002BEC1536|nr:CAP domain-containing protein [Methanoregula sp.]HVP96297.1 CAP domain-containing protein [Methanoregula sp.]
MPRCEFCGKNVALPFHCQYCGKNFCDEHRLPPNHDCAGLAEWKRTPAPGVGIRYGAGGASAYGGGYAAAPKGKKPASVPFWKHPYFRIAVVLVILFLLILIFILAGGCLQPGGNNVTVPASQTPALPLTLPATTGTAAPTLPPATPGVTSSLTPPPTLTLACTPSPPLTTPTETSPPATATPPFPLVTGRVSDDPYPLQASSLAGRIHDLINEQRAENGLAPLSYDPALATLALNHSTDMAENNYFSHVDPAGEDPTARGNASGIFCIKDYGSYYTYGIAENLYQNNLYTSVTDTNGVYSYAWSTPEAIAQSTISGWMNSAGHRKNILTSTFQSEGIGVAVAADDKVYITEDFC